MKYKLDKYELGCLIQCMNENNYCDNNRQQIKNDCLLKLIDVYDDMTTKQKKAIDLTDKEHTLAIECLALTSSFCIKREEMKYVDEISNVIHKLNG